jgi:hypothetical protein
MVFYLAEEVNPSFVAKVIVDIIVDIIRVELVVFL